MKKKIVYDVVTRDFAVFVDGELVGYRPTYQQGELLADATVYDALTGDMRVTEPMKAAHLRALPVAERLSFLRLLTSEALEQQAALFAASCVKPISAETLLSRWQAVLYA